MAICAEVQSTWAPALIIILVLVVLLAIVLVVMYNGLVKLRNKVENAWAQIDVQLKRRYDLIPNLVETVKGYATHERETLEAVIQARNSAMQAGTPQEQAQAENVLTGALKSIFALSEAYPGPEGEPELPEPAGGADLHRGPHRLRAAVLQRHREPLQHQDPDLPHGGRSPACSTSASASTSRPKARPPGRSGSSSSQVP